MVNFKKNNYKFWHSPIALILLFLILIIFAYKIIDLVKTDIETNHKKELILNQIDSLRQRESILNDKISRLSTDEGKEEIIREKYQVAKDGEKLVTIVDNDTNSKPVEQSKTVNHGFWGFVKKLFKF